MITMQDHSEVWTIDANWTLEIEREVSHTNSMEERIGDEIIITVLLLACT
jgi:hypothetical protein